jgi:hypothetical protein
VSDVELELAAPAEAPVGFLRVQDVQPEGEGRLIGGRADTDVRHSRKLQTAAAHLCPQLRGDVVPQRAFQGQLHPLEDVVLRLQGQLSILSLTSAAKVVLAFCFTTVSTMK